MREGFNQQMAQVKAIICGNGHFESLCTQLLRMISAVTLVIDIYQELGWLWFQAINTDSTVKKTTNPDREDIHHQKLNIIINLICLNQSCLPLFYNFSYNWENLFFSNFTNQKILLPAAIFARKSCDLVNSLKHFSLFSPRHKLCPNWNYYDINRRKYRQTVRLFPNTLFLCMCFFFQCLLTVEQQRRLRNPQTTVRHNFGLLRLSQIIAPQSFLLKSWQALRALWQVVAFLVLFEYCDLVLSSFQDDKLIYILKVALALNSLRHIPAVLSHAWQARACTCVPLPVDDLTPFAL